MRILNPIVLALALALPGFTNSVWATAPKIERTPLEECGASSEAGMRDCLATKSHESNVALKRSEQHAMAALSKWDEDPRFINLAKEKLRSSSKAFEQYRDAHCAFAASLGGGAIGNALELRRLSCVVGLNIERARHLNIDSSELTSK